MLLKIKNEEVTIIRSIYNIILPGVTFLYLLIMRIIISVPPVLLFTDITSPTPDPATIAPTRPAINGSSVIIGVKLSVSKNPRKAVNEATPTTVFIRNSVPNTLYETAKRMAFIIRTIIETGIPNP